MDDSRKLQVCARLGFSLMRNATLIHTAPAMPESNPVLIWSPGYLCADQKLAEFEQHCTLLIPREEAMTPAVKPSFTKQFSKVVLQGPL